MAQFVARSHLPVSPAEAFAWHARPLALERLGPPGDAVRVVERAPLAAGSRVVLSVPVLGPLRRRWVAVHDAVEPGVRFVDRQESGPFARWVHEHRFEPAEGGCVLEDRIDYELPLAARPLRGSIERRIARTFAYRHALTRNDIERHRAFGADRPWTIAVSGASGFVGSALRAFLATGGHDVRRLPRIVEGPDTLEGADAIVHLAGESIASGRWTAERKRRILESRVQGTKALAAAIARLETKPSVLVCASAIGFYGDRGDEGLDEGSAAGDGFLAEVCRAWEAATEAAEKAGVRVVRLRIGIVLGAGGGALAKMLPAFQAGVGGRLGSGRQWMSWIALDDLVGAIGAAIFDGSLRGAVNAVSPEPARNADFTRTLGQVLGRPAILPAPALAIRLGLGEMGRELLLASQRVRPRALEAAGFRFRHAALEDALRFELARDERVPSAETARQPVLA